MQREGGHKMRKAFSMLTAIFVILIMATVGAFILNISGKSVKTTTMQYKKEQAALYARSYTELAIMAATANDSTVDECAKNINGHIGNFIDDLIGDGDGYSIETHIAYIGNGLVCGDDILNELPIVTPDSLHIIVDVYVTYKDSSLTYITYHRRTLQKL